MFVPCWSPRLRFCLALAFGPRHPCPEPQEAVVVFERLLLGSLGLSFCPKRQIAPRSVFRALQSLCQLMLLFTLLRHILQPHTSHRPARDAPGQGRLQSSAITSPRVRSLLLTRTPSTPLPPVGTPELQTHKIFNWGLKRKLQAWQETIIAISNAVSAWELGAMAAFLGHALSAP